MTVVALTARWPPVGRVAGAGETMGVPSASCELFVCVKEEDEQLGQAMRKAEKTLANRLAISLSQLFFFYWVYLQTGY